RADHANPLIYQHFDQAAKEHGVANVMHMEFIEAQQTGAPSQLASSQDQRIGLTSISADKGLQFGQERVEMHPTLFGQRRGGEQRVHDEAFAARDATPQVNAGGGATQQ